MPRVLCSIFLFLFATIAAAVPERQSALEALAVLPSEDAKRLARIAACEGSPVPERWHFLTYDPQAESGYHEYVVAHRQIVVRREVSQFATELQPDEIVGAETVQIDSDRAARLAQQYAKENNLSVASLNFQMRRDALGADPVWKITCLDDNDEPLGWLVVSARDEKVVARGGFARTPAQLSQGEPLVNERPPAVAEGGFRGQAARNRKSTPTESPSRPIEVRRAEPVRRPPEPFRLFRGLFSN
jgi:hypothetical protein